MVIETTYNEIKEKYPNALKQLEQKLRRGKSKSKNEPMESGKYLYRIAERIECLTFQDLLNEEPEEKTVDEIVQKRVKNSVATVAVTIGNWTSSVLVDTLPDSVEGKYRKSAEENARERERFTNLSPDEQQKETNKLLGDLTGFSPGELHIIMGTVGSGKTKFG